MKNVQRHIITRESFTGNDLVHSYEVRQFENMGELLREYSEAEIIDIINQRELEVRKNRERNCIRFEAIQALQNAR